MLKAICKISFLLAFCLLGSLSSYAQKSEITGVITDGETEEAIIGATIILKGTSEGTVTDYDGSFSLVADPSTDILIISYIGYKEIELPLGGQTSHIIEMNLDNNELDEVIVIGYGRQKKKVVTGATSTVTAEEIGSTPVLRVEQALQGRTPGVQVTSNSGQPGDAPTVRIRGIGTTGNSNPLYIVDGIAVTGIDYLNPGDIESMHVLKDAASAAIYGARAANGVVLITTNAGYVGKMNVTYSGYYGVQNFSNQLDMLNADEYRMMMNEGARNAGLSEPFDLLRISDHDTDWQEELFQSNVPMQNHQISVAGGNEKSTIATSISYFKQDGVIGGDKSTFDRYTARLNGRHNVNKFFRIGNNLAYTHLTKRGIGTNQSFNGAYSSALNLDPLTPVFETDPTKLGAYPYSVEPVVNDANGNIYGISEYVGAEIVNPLALLETQNSKTRKDELVGNVFGEIEPLENLKFRSNISGNLAYVISDGFKPLFFLNGAQLNDNNTSVDKTIDRYFTWQWENTLDYTKQVGDHEIGGLVGVTALEFNFENLSGFNTGVPTDDPDNVYLNLATDTLWTANGLASHSSLYSLFGRVTYNYQGKYSFTGILRRDGSSKFGANERYGIFPSVGFAWVMSDEPMFANLGPVNYMKARASWGQNGNQEIGDYQFLSSINKTRGYTFGDGREVGSSPSFIENADIRWEESEQYNFGLDFGFFENKLQATFDYYIKNTKGLLEKIAIPGHVGNEGPISNVGSIRNSGFEWALSWRELKGGFNYSLALNGAVNKNEITSIGNSEKVIVGASWALAGPVTRSEEGLPIAFFYGYKTDGIFQNQAEVFQHINRDGELLQENAVPGDVRFVDFNGDGVIDDNDKTQIGNPTPDLTFGFTASVERKGFDVSVFVQGGYGNEIFNGTQRRDLRFTNGTTALLDRWNGEGTSNTAPRYTWIDRNNNNRVSDLYIEDGSFVRVKNAQIGYNFNPQFLGKMNAQAWRIYISAENLFTFTKYTGVDPEIGALVNGDNEIESFNIGIDRGAYPPARTFRVGTSITF